MSDQDAFERIVTALHDATLDGAQWPATSALIDEACGLTGNALLVGEGPTDAVEIVFAGLYYRGQRHPDLEREYLEHYYPIDERVARVRQLPDRHLVHITALYTAQELHTSPTYNEIMARARGQDGLNVRLAGLDDTRITWSLNDPVSPGGWEVPQLALLQGLLPHVEQLIRVRRVLAKAEALSSSVLSLLDNTRLGVIHLDWRGRIVATNDRARALLRRGDGVTDQGGVLAAGLPADQTRFARLVAAALPSSSTPAVSGSMLLSRPSLGPRLVVHLVPTSVRQWDFGAQRVAALVLLVEPGTTPRLDPEVVAAALGLTPIESHIAVQLAAGRTVREIAAATGRAPGAVSWHLKQSYRKLGVARQADLVRVVLSVTAFG